MVVEAAPAAALVVAQSDLLLQLPVVPLDQPARLGGMDQLLERGGRRQVGEPVPARLLRAPGPLDQQPLLRPGLRAQDVAVRRAHPPGGEAGRELGPAAFAPGDGAPGLPGQAQGQVLGGDRLMLRAAPQPGRRPAPARPGRGWQRRLPGRPDGGRTPEAQHIAQVERAHPDPELALVAMPGIAQHDAPGHALLQRLPKLPQCDRRLGFGADLLRHAGLGAPLRIRRPALGQVEPPGDRQARPVVRHRQAHRHLAVVLLAQLPAVLPGDTDRVPALLREGGVVHDPVAHRAVPLDRGQYPLAHRPEQRRIVPLGLGHDVVQRLVLGLHPLRRDPRRHGLHALALARQQQSRAVGPRRGRPAGVAQHRRDPIQVGREALLAGPQPLRLFPLLRHTPICGEPRPNRHSKTRSLSR
jgi:hypothetical protein